MLSSESNISPPEHCSFAEGLFERWEVGGTMAVDILGPSSVEIDIRWD